MARIRPGIPALASILAAAAHITNSELAALRLRTEQAPAPNNLSGQSELASRYCSATERRGELLRTVESFAGAQISLTISSLAYSRRDISKGNPDFPPRSTKDI